MMTVKHSDWGPAAFCVETTGGDQFTVVVNGRDRWALQCLVSAGERGCTPIDNPGPRWSGYAFNLRQMGIEIETIRETHDGPFPGNHARYVLKSTVTRDSGSVGKDERGAA